jgi:hypothetical protein
MKSLPTQARALYRRKAEAEKDKSLCLKDGRHSLGNGGVLDVHPVRYQSASAYKISHEILLEHLCEDLAGLDHILML